VKNMSENGERRGGSMVTVVTFTVEILIYTAILTATCGFVSNYFSVLRIPALVFMFLNTVSTMLAMHTLVMVLIFSTRRKSADAAFSDNVLCDFSQGFTVISSILWVLFLVCVFIDVPRITSVSGFPPSASIISCAVVIGFSTVIPLLSMVATYAAVPVDAQNSLMFNGAAVGAFSFLFFTIVSFGSGGVMKCSPYDGSGTTLIFCIFVIVYWVLLYLVELVIFFQWNPLHHVWASLTGGDVDLQDGDVHTEGSVKLITMNYWRIPGCVLNMIIVASTTGFSQAEIQGTIGLVAVLVGLIHIPLIVTINFDYWLLQPTSEESEDNANNHNYSLPDSGDARSFPTKYQSVPANNNESVFPQTFPSETYTRQSNFSNPSISSSGVHRVNGRG
jgi:hypothetical protein